MELGRQKYYTTTRVRLLYAHTTHNLSLTLKTQKCQFFPFRIQTSTTHQATGETRDATLRRT
eukprot:scaffold44822_cov78-Phaeocystis_antarctica.AAC.1